MISHFHPHMCMNVQMWSNHAYAFSAAVEKNIFCFSCLPFSFLSTTLFQFPKAHLHSLVVSFHLSSYAQIIILTMQEYLCRCTVYVMYIHINMHIDVRFLTFILKKKMIYTFCIFLLPPNIVLCGTLPKLTGTQRNSKSRGVERGILTGGAECIINVIRITSI